MYANIYHSSIYKSKKWRHPKCLATDERMLKVQCTHTVEYYSAIKRNGKLIYAMSLESITLQSRKETHTKNLISNDPIYVKCSKSTNPIRRLAVVRHCGKQRIEECLLMGIGFHLGDKNILKLGSDNCCTTL